MSKASDEAALKIEAKAFSDPKMEQIYRPLKAED
jgi:hypothetical protein